MRPNPQETADLVTFAEEICNGKLHFLGSVKLQQNFWSSRLVLELSWNNHDLSALQASIIKSNYEAIHKYVTQDGRRRVQENVYVSWGFDNVTERSNKNTSNRVSVHLI